MLLCVFVGEDAQRYQCFFKRVDSSFVCQRVQSRLQSVITLYVALRIFLQVCCAVMFVTFHVGGSVDK